MKASTLTSRPGMALLAILASLVFASAPQKAAAQEPFVGEIRLFGFNFCPRGWANADGRLLDIASNQALFSLYGTYYGGDGRTTFALPDLRGRAPINMGQAPGLSDYRIGEKTGTEQFTMTIAQLPSHSHGVTAKDQSTAGGGQAADALTMSGTPADQTVEDVISNTGGSQPVRHRGPILTLNWCVALEGIYPSRN